MGWMIAGVSLVAFVLWTIVINVREHRRQRQIATTRAPLSQEHFIDLLTAEGIERRLAAFLWAELTPHYVSSLTPYPSDRLCGDLKIDPDDINDIAPNYEERFGAWLGEVPIDCPDDPSIVAFAAALQRQR